MAFDPLGGLLLLIAIVAFAAVAAVDLALAFVGLGFSLSQNRPLMRIGLVIGIVAAALQVVLIGITICFAGPVFKDLLLISMVKHPFISLLVLLPLEALIIQGIITAFGLVLAPQLPSDERNDVTGSASNAPH